MNNEPRNASSMTSISRRNFLKTAGAAILLPTILPSSVLGRGGKAPPSGTVTMGVIGWGSQGPGDASNFLREQDCRVVAVCDVDKTRMQGGVNTVNRRYGNQDCKGYTDFRELLARPDLDAILMAVPDNWHGIVATEALNKGLDVYGEKPLARTIAEQQAIVKAVKANNAIWQTGSWQRSQTPFRKAAEIVRNGLIGEVTRVEVGLPGGGGNMTRVTPDTDAWKRAVTDPPAELDYDMWLGPAEKVPYISARVHYNWRWNYNTGGGQLLDWIGHHCDIAHWGMDWDNNGPSEIEGKGDFPPKDAVHNTSGRYRIEMKYPGNVTMVIAGGYNDIRSGAKWIGKDGWVWVDRGGFDGSNADWKRGRNLAEELRKVKLYESADHYRNFLDCVLSRKPTIAPADTAHHSAIPGHLGLISMLTGKKLRWDVKTETILDDPESSKLLNREFRTPWKLA